MTVDLNKAERIGPEGVYFPEQMIWVTKKTAQDLQAILAEQLSLAQYYAEREYLK